MKRPLLYLGIMLTLFVSFIFLSSRYASYLDCYSRKILSDVLMKDTKEEIANFCWDNVFLFPLHYAS